MVDYAVSVSLGGISPGTGEYLVTAYGADNTGVADSTVAIQACINAAEAAGGGTIIFPKGEYSLSSGIDIQNTTAFGTIEVSAQGAVFTFGTGIAGALITIGNAAARSYSVIWTGGKVWFGDTTTRDWTSTVGIQLINASTCRVRDFIVMNCEKGVEIKGINGGGCSYNTVEPMDIINCETAISCVHDGASSWNTENTFIGGKINYTSALAAVDCTGGSAIYIRGENTPDQHSEQHKFYGTSLECSTSIPSGSRPTLIDMEGRYHLFSGIRNEGFNANSITINGVTGLTTSYGNLFLGGRAYRWADVVEAASAKYATFISGNQHHFCGIATSTQPITIIENTGTNIGTSVDVLVVKETVASNLLQKYGVASNGQVTAGDPTSTTASVNRFYGTTTPEGVFTANPGSMFQCTVGGANSIYLKESGTGNTGWRGIWTNKVLTSADGDTTPTVFGATHLLIPSNTGATAITQLDDSVAGQQVTIVLTNATNPSTVADSATFILAGGAAWGGSIDDTITLFTANGGASAVWREICRSAN